MLAIRIPIGLVLATYSAGAQQYFISTYAGSWTPPPVSAHATDVSFHWPWAVAADAAGNVYFASDNSVFKMDASGTVIRVAGGLRYGYAGDGGPATLAQLSRPQGLAVDRAGNLYIADTQNNAIRKVLPNGVIVTIAGNGSWGFSGDGGPATSAQLATPSGVAVDSSGNLFISDSSNSRVRKVASTGIITTLAGNGTPGYPGDGGPAINAQLGWPTGIAADNNGNVFIAEESTHRIRRVSPNGVIDTVAGTGIAGFGGDGGPATSAQLASPVGVAVTGGGSLFVVQLGWARVRMVSPGGTITTVACCGTPYEFSGDGGPAISAGLFNPYGIAVDPAGNLFIADTADNRVRKVSPSGIINTVAGNGGAVIYDEAPLGDGGQAANAQLRYPWSVAAGNGGDIFIADTEANRIRRVTRDGVITTIAGNGTQGFSGDNGPAVNAQLKRAHRPGDRSCRQSILH
jgi:sugar lactone lactonase YvrE